MPHRARPEHRSHQPVHVTLRAGLTLLRRQFVFVQIRGALASASRSTFRVVEFSVQTNHVHMLVEADDKATLAGGIRGLAIRAARSINRAVGRVGRVWSDRYHARALTTPREVRNALVYILMNRKKHVSSPSLPGPQADPCSSAVFFDGWRPRSVPHPSESGCPDRLDSRARRSSVARARTWLASIGWRKHGLLGRDEAPKSMSR